MAQSRERWFQFSKRLWVAHTRRLCTGANRPVNSNNVDAIVDAKTRYMEDYKKLSNLTFPEAAKILFSTPPYKKKFGFDFHLVQFFFACMPSLAVFLVAQYAHYEMRKMEAELDLKKKAEEEKAKALEAIAAEEKEKEAAADPHLLEVKVRLDKLEETVKEFVVGSEARHQGDGTKSKIPSMSEPKNSQQRPEASSSATKGNLSKENTIEGVTPSFDTSRKDQKERDKT